MSETRTFRDARQANARLIAAAPDLYAALKVAHRWIIEGQAEIGWSASRLAEVLAKAEGRDV